MKTQKLEFFVGLFVLAGLLLLAGLIIFFGKVVQLGRDRYEVAAIFENVHGMSPGTPVRYLGIDVGELKKTGFTERGDKVKLTLSISTSYRIPADAQLRVRPTGILGDYYLEFEGGSPDKTGYLPTDGTAVIQGEPMITIDEIVSQLTGFTAKLSDSLDSLGGNLTALSGSLNELLGDEQFRKDIKATAAEAPGTIKSFKEMAAQIAEASAQTSALVKRMKPIADKLDTQIGRQGENMDKLTEGLLESTQAINETLASLDEILDRFKQGKGTIGRLVKDDDLHESLVKAVDQLNEALKEITKTAQSVHRKWGR